MAEPRIFRVQHFDAAARQLMGGIERVLVGLWDDPQVRREAQASMQPVRERAKSYARGNMKGFITIQLLRRASRRQVARGTDHIRVKVGYRTPPNVRKVLRPGHKKPTPAITVGQALSAEWGSARGIGRKPPRGLQRALRDEGVGVINEMASVVERGVARRAPIHIPRSLTVRS